MPLRALPRREREHSQQEGARWIYFIKRCPALNASSNAILTTIKFEKTVHEGNLIQSGLKEEFAELAQSFVGEIASAINIRLSGCVCSHKRGQR